jgi:hypothetical protein
MNATNGHGGPDAGAAVAVARPVVLVRYRPGVTGETARTVHMIPLPTDERVGVVGALCGAALMVHDIEIVTLGESMPCTMCVVTQALGTVPTGEPGADAAGLAAGGVAYQGWGWPVTLHRDQVQLNLHRGVSARAIPLPLATEATEILTRRRCTPPVLAHPYAPDHHIVLTGERYGAPLPCPGPTRCTRSTASYCCPPPSPHAGRSPGYSPRRRTHSSCAARSISWGHCAPRYATPQPSELKAHAADSESDEFSGSAHLRASRRMIRWPPVSPILSRVPDVLNQPVQYGLTLNQVGCDVLRADVLQFLGARLPGCYSDHPHTGG